MSHCEYYGVWCVRDSSSVAGPGQAWFKSMGFPVLFTTRERAEQEAQRLNDNRLSDRLRYHARVYRADVPTVR
jgi:hypothetical protein